MSETGNSDKTVTAAPPKATLHLKRPVEQGTVRQSFSHGRSKAVVVEKVKRRILTPAEAAAAARPAPPAPAAAPPPAAPAPAKPTLDRLGAARSRRARQADRTAAAQDRRRPAHLDRRAARSARPGADRRARVGGGRSPPPGGGCRGSARARGARPPRTRGCRSAQARRRASPRAGGQFQAAVGGRSPTTPFRRRTGAVSVDPARCPGCAQRGRCRERSREPLPLPLAAQRKSGGSSLGVRRSRCRRGRRSSSRRLGRRAPASSATAAA